MNRPATPTASVHSAGRWPPNVALGHSPECAEACEPDCAVRLLDEQSGERTSGGNVRSSMPSKAGYDGGWRRVDADLYGDTGGASRFMKVVPSDEVRFRYVPKAGRRERAGSSHPTHKPEALMRWLCRLVTPPGGLILDPFLGSGTTLVAAAQEGFRAIGIEREAEYVEIAKGRLSQPIQAGML